MINLITQEMLNRINELARKKRSVGLNAEELAEQKKLYEEYLLSIRGQMINLLDSIKIVDANADGEKKVEDTKKNEKSSPQKIFQQTHIVIGQRRLH